MKHKPSDSLNPHKNETVIIYFMQVQYIETTCVHALNSIVKL